MNYRTELGRQFLVNVGRVRNPVANGTSLTETVVNFTPDTRPPGQLQKWIVADGLSSINQTLAGIYNGNAFISLTPNKINGRTNSGAKDINVNDISFAVMDGSNAILFVQQRGLYDLAKWQFNSTSLIALSQLINGATTNQVFSASFGSCTTSTQPVTYTVNQAGNLILERFNGSSFVTIDSDAVAAGTGTNTFSFPPGDLINGNLMRVSLKTSTQIYPIASSTFSCAGGSGSGSGITGDCNMYAYFDGDGWNNTLDTLNWGASCTLGYVIQVSTSSNFTDLDSYVVDTTTEDTLIKLTLANGTYYARVRNIGGQTRFSPTLTFVAS